MKEQIEPILKGIYTSLQHYRTPSLGLIGDGTTSTSLYNYLYLKYTNQLSESDDLQNQVQQLAESVLTYPHLTLCAGRSGVHWFFTYLHKNGLLDTEDWELLCSEDEELAAQALQMLENDNYDFLHGATGIAYQLLYQKANRFDSFFIRFFELLQLLIRKSNRKIAVPHWDFKSNGIDTNKVNLGLAHGIPAILKFCLQCYEQNICPVEAKAVAQQLIGYLLDSVNKDTTINYFPTFIDETATQDGYSRMAWCYGDLTVSYILYQAGVLFRDQPLTVFSLQVLKHAAGRRDRHSTGINDAGICHGTAGVAHVFNRMWQLTKDPLFKEACDYWIATTLSFTLHEDGMTIYKKYDNRDNTYVTSYSLLEGSAGIGLVLLSYLNNDFSWDYCIMLN